jgi:hypothetical protein
MNIRRFRAFSSEMMKIAGDLADSDVRALLADRRGDQDYLIGGELESNGEETAKEAGVIDAPLAAGAYDLKSKTKIDGPYQKARDYAAAAGKGALTGAGIIGLADKLTHTTFANHKHYRTAAGLGAAAMVADKAFRHHQAAKEDAEKTAGIVMPNPGRAFKSPASAMATAQKTGGFKSKVVHNVGKPPKLVQLGQKFKMPTL